jgi:hypothetical protein
LTHHAVIPSRDFQLDNDVAAVSIEGEDVAEPPADRELNAGYPFFVGESQASGSKPRGGSRASFL